MIPSFLKTDRLLWNWLSRSGYSQIPQIQQPTNWIHRPRWDTWYTHQLCLDPTPSCIIIFNLAHWCILIFFPLAGLVRAIDPSRQLYYVTTPLSLSPELLDRVNVLAIGSIDSLPHTQRNAVSEESLYWLGSNLFFYTGCNTQKPLLLKKRTELTLILLSCIINS